ncbi:MAG TPA: 4Fe-4S dicluster domain-containing protein [Streptosporangiaceae bacterium]|nr:4Fe-4S dicluster domain-containing protein [Streptosporangiaceae bacterium]
MTSPEEMAGGQQPARWVKVLDQDRCIGCHACTTACKSENDVPLGVTRTFVKSVDVGLFPQARRAFQVTRCNQCADAPCVAACPTGAMFRRDDGIVDFDKSVCIGCKACMAACPYDAIFINPEDHSAEKCNFCAHRLDIGLEPACVTVCPTQAILVGDVNDPDSEVARIVQREPVTVRRPEKETRPGLFYKGAHQATLDPLAARRPGGDLLAWATQGGGRAGHVTSGHPRPEGHNSSAAAVISYDIPHQAPWGWRVSLYTWTKSIAAGGMLVPVILLLLGKLAWSSPAARWAPPSLALALLGVTGILLIWDLKHPLRFYMIFTRPRWGSWLVRGSFIIAGYGGVVTAYLAASIAGAVAGHPAGALLARQVLADLSIPLAAGAAVYTAYLFAQAKARDAWQNPLLAPHLAVQAVLAGAASWLPLAMWLSPGQAVTGAEALLAAAAAVHLIFVAGEFSLTHPTAHAKLAAQEMYRGRFAWSFWPGIALAGAAVAAPWIGVAAVPLALAGLLAHEHAFVQAGQAVPLA